MSEEILINVTPQETRAAAIENGVLQGEAGASRMHLTCIRAAERPAMDGRAGVQRSGDVTPGMAGTAAARYRG
ncbi:hypothetical protein SVA_0608 [Sulfurifustis variabilis]|uniref:Uncharacterized protein n=1 Tax=Sulfurifustis variabilis TaxID=1675686 RepID=A0A1B4V131_9GAMM|nr:hypothetical protein [Sulfurifustis variabilis]BAU47186.1 hypothetical protein SVA_0607 [Sulfurifustis variabilis]BAU47187.1 hypothetical protein SVA_0608 [Sulfurifustis variabilis]